VIARYSAVVRYYDPQTGQFTQQDPIGIAGGLNLYGFAGGDPVNFSDPFGLVACDPPDDPCEEGEQSTPTSVQVWGGPARVVVGELASRTAAVVEGLALAYTGGQVAGSTFRIGRALFAASTRTGAPAVTMASATETAIAGRLWVLGGRAISAERGAGPVIGRISADATRVYRAARLKLTGPDAGLAAANLERWLTIGGKRSIVSNVHLVIR